MNLGGAAARGVTVTVAGQAVRGAIQFAAIIVLSRLLTPGDFGIYAMVISLVGIASLLADFGLSMAAIQSGDVSPAQRSNLFWLNLALGLAIGAVVFSLARPIGAFYGRSEVESLTRVVAGVFVFDAAAAQFKAELSAKLRFVWLAVADVAAQASGFVVGCVLAVDGRGYWALVGQQMAVVVVTLAVTAAGAGWLPGLPRRVPMRRLLNFGANAFGVQVLVYLTSNIDNIVLGRTVDATTLGVYSRAYQLFRLPLVQIAAPMTKVAFPILSRVKDDDEVYQRYVERGQLVLAYLFGGAFVTLAGLSGPVVDIALGGQWSRASTLVMILAAGGCFQALGYVYYWVFLSRALTSVQLRYSAISRVLMLGLVVACSHWGAIGVAGAVSAGLFLAWAFNALFAMRASGVAVAPLLAIAARPLALFAPIAVLGIVLNAYVGSWGPVYRAALVMGIAAVYLPLMYAMCGPIRRDVQDLAGIGRKIRTL